MCRCSACPQSLDGLKLNRQRQQFYASGLLCYIAINILVQLPRTANGNQYIIFMTDRLSKRSRAMSTGRLSSAHVANVLFDYRIGSHGILVYVLADNKALFSSKLFATLCIMPGVNCLTTTAYQTQTSAPLKEYNDTVVTRRRHYVAKH